MPVLITNTHRPGDQRRPEWIETASLEEWDDFESGYMADVEEWLANHQDHPQAAETRKRTDDHLSIWLRGSRCRNTQAELVARGARRLAPSPTACRQPLREYADAPAADQDRPSGWPPGDAAIPGNPGALDQMPRSWPPGTAAGSGLSARDEHPL
jgi:hypothetical protein